MFTTNVTELQIDNTVPLLIQVDPSDSLSPWQQVGTITRTATRLEVCFRSGAGHVLAVWDTCIGAGSGWVNPRSIFAMVRFGVFCAKRGVQVLATGRVDRRDLARAQASAWRRQKEVR